jgi:dipeptidyl aminopeptidase/acylaminoacyl peptidase
MKASRWWCALSRKRTEVQACSQRDAARTYAHVGPVRCLLCWVGLVLASSLSGFALPGQKPAKRAVTVVDAIEMTRPADQYPDRAFRTDVALFSPNGKLFVIVLQKGNVKRNLNEFSLLLYQAKGALTGSKPEVLLRMSSSSNREAISKILWLRDNRTLLFLGENPGEVSQIYKLDIRTRKLERITKQRTVITNFDATPDGQSLVFTAEPFADPFSCRKQAKIEGLVIRDQRLADLMKDPCGGAPYDVGLLFFENRQHGPIPISLSDPILDEGVLLLSPDGKHVVVTVGVRSAGTAWKLYEDDLIQRSLQEEKVNGRIRHFKKYELVDLAKKTERTLLDAPMLGTARVCWAPGGRSVLLEKMFLPLDVPDAEEREARRRNRYNAEIEITTGQYRKVSEGCPVEGPRKSVEVSVEESLNTPPVIRISDKKTRTASELLDLNPQFADLKFGDVRVTEWKGTDGEKWRGGLYLPADYVPGRRYPLVIQTHGFVSDRFSMDGMSEWSSAFAARPLASRGIIVLQLGRIVGKTLREFTETPREAPLFMAAVEGAIEFLSGQGLVDRERIGISGFSRTYFLVAYTLTHSKEHFAAANLVEGIDTGYFQFVAFGLGSNENGGPPFGEGMELWLKNSPGFNLQQVNAPVRLVSLGGSDGLLIEWEWFSILKYLDRPVDFILLPDAAHQVVKPWERLVAQQGMVDWFAFWLKGEEDSDLSKRAEYERWRKLRALGPEGVLLPPSS